MNLDLIRAAASTFFVLATAGGLVVLAESLLELFGLLEDPRR